MDRTFSIATVGCKLNQYESQWIRERLGERGWVERRAGETAAVCIINTCGVTARSEARCRAAARRARRLAPDALVVVTGCCAETAPEGLRRTGAVDLVVDNARKRSLPDIVETLAARGAAASAGIGGALAEQPPNGAARRGISRFSGHARAFVGIQDGCDAACSYCIVPRARGRSRSVDLRDVLAEIAVLRENGYREIVLTGIHIGRYGHDASPRRELADLVESILERFDDIRVRLSSVEPTEVTPRLVDLVRASERMAPHFHVPLQSGDDDILAAMNRPYRAERYREAIAEIARCGPSVAIGADIIVGFPGETEERFERTAALAREAPLAYVHVFSFSPRPGTAAASMDGQVAAADKKRRSRALIDLGAAKRRAFEEAQIGAEHLALVEGPARPGGGWVRVLTGNYCEAIVPAGGARERSLVRVLVTSRERGMLRGTFVPEGRFAATRERGAR